MNLRRFIIARALRDSPVAPDRICNAEEQPRMSRRRPKPYDPAEAARQKAERERYTRNTPGEWGPNEEALAGQDDVTSQAATRTRVRRLQRFDVFHLLFTRGSLEETSLVAVRRLEADLACEHRVDGEPTLGRIDGATGGAEFRALDAGHRNRQVLGLMQPHHVRLILALTLPAVVHGQRINWKAIVRELHGNVDRDAQVRRVKLACGALAAAYNEIDYGAKKAA